MKLDHIQLAIPPGLESECRAFWCGLLGFTEIEKPATLQHRGGAWFSHGGTKVHLGVEQDFRPAQKAHPAFGVSKLADLADRLSGAGHPIHWDTEIAGRKRFFTDDPVGNRIEFTGEP